MADKNIAVESGYEFDFSGVKLDYYDDPENRVQGLHSVDFIIENETHILFIEVKNPDCPESTEERKKEFFESIRNHGLIAEIGRKFKDSLLRKYAEGYIFEKPVKYIFILQFDRYYAKQRNNFRKSLINDHIPAKKLNSEEFKAFCKFESFEMPNIKQFCEKYKFPVRAII